MRSSLIAGDQLEEIILERWPQRRNRKNSRLAVSQLLQDGIQLHLGDFHAIAFPDFCGGSGERGWGHLAAFTPSESAAGCACDHAERRLAKLALVGIRNDLQFGPQIR